MRWVLPTLWIALVAAACGKDEPPVLDAGIDFPLRDAPPPPIDKQVSLAVDFTVENCPSFDPVALTCSGQAPLVIRFVPLSTTTVRWYRWDFGDASPSDSSASPSHVFSIPGTYTVSLIATGESDMIEIKERKGFVIVRPNQTGDPCQTNEQCDLGLACLCPTTAACTGGPPRGMCTSECTSGRCADGLSCANLRTTTMSVEPWQTSLCLPPCKEDTDCGAGLRCRLLPPGGSGGWIRGCFADVPKDVGEPCRDSTGKLRDDLCATGLCVDFGVLGMCSKKCGDIDACPRGSDCMTMGDGTKLCLRPCGEGDSFPCNRDPLLTCVQPTAGALGYQIPSAGNSGNTSFASIYCAPKTCTPKDIPPVCAPSGVCLTAGGGSHCVRQ